MIVAVANQKGGVGKSTAVINLAAAFALKAAWQNRKDPGRVLVIDMDPQCNTVVTMAGGVFSGETPPERPVTLADFLAYRTSAPVREAILTSHLPQRGVGNLDYIYSTSASMKGVRNELAGSGAADAGYRLVEVVNEVRPFYSTIFIDTGPAEDWLTTNALAAASHVILPIEPAGFSLQGIQENLIYIDKVQRLMNPELEVLGILPSRFHSQYTTQQDILDLVGSQYKKLILPIIAERASIYDAVQAGLDIFSFKPPRGKGKLRSSDPATLEFAAVADEVERRLR
jgi:chromosome partitioning protein